MQLHVSYTEELNLSAGFNSFHDNIITLFVTNAFLKFDQILSPISDSRNCTFLGM